MDFLNIVLLGILGLALGSFLGAFSYRWPRNISIAKGRSFCPNCKNKIAWYDNIPLISFLLLSGKCRNCKKPISGRYPLIEFITALLFISLGFYYLTPVATSPSSPALIWRIITGPFFLPYLLFLFSFLIAIFIIDLENQLIPDSLVNILLILVSIELLSSNNFIFSYLLAGFGASLFLLFLAFVTKGKGMGLGDVKLALPLGAILGPSATLVWLFLSFLIGGIFSIILLVTGKASFGKRIAFGPFLIISFAITFFWSNVMLRLIGL